MAALMPPFSFRFAEEDQANYGDGWYTFDEAKLSEVRARDLLAWERPIKAVFGMTILEAVRDFAHGGIAGSLTVMWLALRQAGRDDVSLVDFNPLVLVGETKLGEAPEEVPPGSASSSSQENEGA